MKKIQIKIKRNEIKPNKETFQLTWSTTGKCFLGQNVYFILSMLVSTLKCERSVSQHKQVQTRLHKQLKKHAQGTPVTYQSAFITAGKCRIQPKVGIAWHPSRILTESDFRSNRDLCPDLAVLRKTNLTDFVWLLTINLAQWVCILLNALFVCLLDT